MILLHGRQAMPGCLLDYQELLFPLQPLASCARVPDVPHWSPCWGQGLAVQASSMALCACPFPESQESLAAAGEGGVLVEKLGLT